MKIKCRECGALIDGQVARCPYCGAINEAGAEQKYMEDMDTLRDNLEDLGDIPKEEITQEIRKHLKFTGKTVVITLVVIIVVAAALFLYSKRWDIAMYLYETASQTTTADAREQLLWEKENYPRLDEWFAEGKFDALLDFYRENSYVESGIQYNFSTWEHYYLLTYYDEYRECTDFWERLKGGEIPCFYEYHSPFYEGLDLIYSKDAKYRNDMMSDEDRALVEQWRDEVTDFIREVYGIDDAEIQRQIQSADTGDGYLKYKGLYDYVDTMKDLLPHADERRPERYE